MEQKAPAPQIFTQKQRRSSWDLALGSLSPSSFTFPHAQRQRVWLTPEVHFPTSLLFPRPLQILRLRKFFLPSPSFLLS